ncbi:GNAT family N-acetyltransferase [Plantactinospora endophytica]|nr:GNAT family N-acetyltransferase [Plantactinospora endophytica]
MSLDQEASSSTPIRLASAAGDDVLGIMAAVELGNKARATLGHMPFAGYRDAAEKGTLLLAYAGEQIIGYALYGLTSRRVRLTHLCVDPHWHGYGIARLLVDWVSDHHSDYPGILAKCRDSYNLGDMWIKLRFTPLSQRPGRSRARHLLTSWWRDHGQPNLFTRDDDSVLARAAVDLNVLRDLADEERSDAVESRALVGDQFADRLELVRTGALDSEVNSMEGPLRARCITAAQSFTPPPRVDHGQLKQVRADLLAAVHLVDPKYPCTDQDRYDLEHVCEAIALGLKLFVTRDEHLTSILGPPAQRQHGLRILRPLEVLIHIDELARAEAYQPAALLGTRYRRQLLGIAAEDDLAGLVNSAAGERRRDLRNTNREMALAGCDRAGIYDPDGRLVAVIAARPENGALTVPLARVATIGLADTLARQLLFQLRQKARAAGSPIIKITDRYVSAALRLAAFQDGFYQHDEQLYAFVIDVCGPAGQVEQQAVAAARQAGVPVPAPLGSDMPAVAAAELERIWWPAKITDSALLTYLIPIRQAYSADLLGVPGGLLPRHDNLGLAREHVYYRSPRGTRPRHPARLLWYMSRSGPATAYPAAVIACSQLDLAEIGAPEDFHARFQHLGVWDGHQLHNVAHNGQVQALRFTNTELLTHISSQRLQVLAAAHQQRGVPPPGPLRIPPGLFAALYQEGRRQ